MGDEASVKAGQADDRAGPAAEAPGPDLVRREILIPGGHGAAFAARAGQLVEIIDLEGQQVADFVAFAERNRTEWLSTTHTRSALLRLTAVVGDRLDTDIEGAHRAGMDSLLVLTGVSRREELDTAPPEQKPTYVAADLSALIS